MRDLAGITFGQLAERYLAEGMGHLAGTAQDDRRRLLGKDGPLVRAFGDRRAAEVARADLLDWYHREITGEGRAENTGKQYLAALAGARGCGGPAYRRPLEVTKGEVPAEMLLRLEVSPHKSPMRKKRGHREPRSIASSPRILYGPRSCRPGG